MTDKFSRNLVLN